MFTGIVRELGEVAAIDAAGGGARLTVRAPDTAAATAVGDSVSVNGVCLTAVATDDGTLAFDAVPETLERSALARLAPGSPVNLEPALRAGEPLGGHIAATRFGANGRAVEPRVDAVAAHVEPLLGAIAAPVEPLLDAVASRGGVRGNLHRARQQPQTEPYCTALHSRPP